MNYELFFRPLVRVNCYKNPGDWYQKDFISIYDALQSEAAATAASSSMSARVNSNSLSSSLDDAMVPINYFVARATEIEEIKEIFKTIQFFLIHGKSGSGKTTLARHFVEEVRKEMIVWWISCSGINMRLQYLAERLSMTKANCTLEELVENIKFGLGNKKFMFVLDNLDVESEEQKEILRVIINSNSQSNIKFLITAKTSKASEMFSENFDRLGLKLFGKNECLSMIRKQLDTSNLNDDQLGEILDKVEYLPIKITGLVAKIKKMKYNTHEDLLKVITKNNVENYETFETEHPVEYKLVKYMSYLDGQSISIELIRSILLNEDSKEIGEAMEYLEEVSILSENEKNEYTIHESIQKEVQDSLGNEDERKRVVNDLIIILISLYESNQLKEISKTERLSLYTQIFNILEYTENTENILKWKIYTIAATLYDKIVNYKKSKEYFEKALDIRRNVLPDNHPDIADSLKNLCVSYSNLGDHQKAIEYAEEASEINRNVLPVNHPKIADSLNSLGVSYCNLGDHQKAIENFEKALVIYRNALPDNHPDNAHSLQNLGVSYCNLGDHQKAIEYFEKALVISRNALPDNHPDIAASLNNLGVSYGKLADHQKAIEYFEKALVISRNALPDNHPDIADSLNNLGVSYGKLGDHQKAIEYFEDALVIRRNALPDNHPDIADSLNSLGASYCNRCEHKKAIEYFEKALKIRRNALPDNHPKIAESLNNLLHAKRNVKQYYLM